MNCSDRSVKIFVRGDDRGRGPQASLAEAKDRAAKEKATREKHEARVSEVQQELQDTVKKYESLEHDFKDRESELAKARQSAQDAQAEP